MTGARPASFLPPVRGGRISRAPGRMAGTTEDSSRNIWDGIIAAQEIKNPDELLEEAATYASSQGILYVAAGKERTYTHAPLSLLPNAFPAAEYAKAVKLAPLFNRLVEAVADDGPWLLETLKSVLPHDDFTRRLVEIYRTVHGEGQPMQKVHLGINRSDYMLNGEDLSQSKILQVEINTIASSFGCLSTRISRLHDYLIRKTLGITVDPEWTLPHNDVISALAKAVAFAHNEYLRQLGGKLEGRPTVAMIVQPGERNVFDQKALEVALFETQGVPVKRVTLAEMVQRGRLSSDAAHPRLVLDGAEITVAYFRAGYTPNDYPSETEWDGRLLIEKSLAVKCPCISYHLAGTKKVQEALSRPGTLERFVKDPEEANLLRSSFAGLYGFGPGEGGEEAMVRGLEKPEDFVLKPQREGGGNNLYGDEMVEALQKMTQDETAAYILMERIHPPEQQSLLARDHKVITGTTVSELGVYGVYVGGGEGVGELMNEPAGHLLRTKLSSSNEGGVAAGFAVLSSPMLVGPLDAEDALLISRGRGQIEAIDRFKPRLTLGLGTAVLMVLGVMAWKPRLLGFFLKGLGLQGGRRTFEA